MRRIFIYSSVGVGVILLTAFSIFLMVTIANNLPSKAAAAQTFDRSGQNAQQAVINLYPDKRGCHLSGAPAPLPAGQRVVDVIYDTSCSPALAHILLSDDSEWWVSTQSIGFVPGQ